MQEQNTEFWLGMMEIEKLCCPSDPGKPQKIRIRMTRPAEPVAVIPVLSNPDETLVIAIGTDKLLDILFQGF